MRKDCGTNYERSYCATTLNMPNPEGNSCALDVPGPMEQMFGFCIAYLLVLSLLLLALPEKWMRRVIQIALHLGGGSKIGGEVR
jgi:hypothetical protein